MKRLEDAKQVDTMFTENAKQTDNSRFSSRVELDMAIAEVHKKVEDAISNKQFGEASTYQAELDELESLRSTLPSIEEMEIQLKELKAEIDSAIEGKNFKKAESVRSSSLLDQTFLIGTVGGMARCCTSWSVSPCNLSYDLVTDGMYRFSSR